MQLGMFVAPAHPPEGALYDKIKWDLAVTQWADELGFREAWFGEHFTLPWEPVCAPDLLIAQAALQTERIRLAPGAHLLPYHHPVELAHRLMQLDHMLQGRLMVGIGAGTAPTDTEMFQMSVDTNENRRRMLESLDIMLKIWAGEEFEFRGDFWSVSYKPKAESDLLGSFYRPFQTPHPPIGLAGGVSIPSSTLRLAGERGAYPMSFSFPAHVVAAGWESVVEGARGAGRTAKRSEWRIVREIFVAETDAEARKFALNGPMARFFEEYFLPLLRATQAVGILKHNPGVSDSDVTVDYLLDRLWLVGSPDTVAEKLASQYEEIGGFGYVLATCYDYSKNPGPWRASMELMATEVMPKLAHLDAD